MMRSEFLDGPTVARGVSLPRPLMDAAKERAWRERRPFSRLVRDALMRYLTEVVEDQNDAKSS